MTAEEEVELFQLVRSELMAEGNGEKSALEAMLNHTTKSLEQVAVSQTKMAEAILTNSEALSENTRRLADITEVFRSQIQTEHELLLQHKAQEELIREIPAALRQAMTEEIQNVPTLSWRWIYEGLQRIGGAVGGIGVIVVITYFVIQWATAALK